MGRIVALVPTLLDSIVLYDSDVENCVLGCCEKDGNWLQDEEEADGRGGSDIEDEEDEDADGKPGAVLEKLEDVAGCRLRKCWRGDSDRDGVDDVAGAPGAGLTPSAPKPDAWWNSEAPGECISLGSLS
ncbi:hypothetical protein MPER_09024 [Moniliophthora perniciosa FA553]|nr:hypothetical protein MPER_09024 [Moniliophthora perniciosa FA553]